MTLAPPTFTTEVTLTERIERIHLMDLGPIKWTLTQPQYGKPATMTPEEADVAIAQYKMMLSFWAEDQNSTITPSRMIDEVWHAHILDAGKYAEDMVFALGYTPMHYPYFGVQDAKAEQWLKETFDHSARAFAAKYGVDIIATSVAWQRTFDTRMQAHYASLVIEEHYGSHDARAECGTVRCCKACNVDVTGSAAMAEVLFGTRPTA